MLHPGLATSVSNQVCLGVCEYRSFKAALRTCGVCQGSFRSLSRYGKGGYVEAELIGCVATNRLR